jgi:hypothetical protein
MSEKQVRQKSRQKTSGNFCVFRTFGEEFEKERSEYIWAKVTSILLFYLFFTI